MFALPSHRQSFPRSLAALALLGAGGRSVRLRRDGRRHDRRPLPIPPNTISMIASSSRRSAQSSRARRRIAGPDGKGRNRRRRVCGGRARLSQRVHFGPRTDEARRGGVATQQMPGIGAGRSDRDHATGSSATLRRQGFPCAVADPAARCISARTLLPRRVFTPASRRSSPAAPACGRRP